LIPKLASLTLLDHQNFGAGAPCVAAGACEPGNMPEDIINASNPSEPVAMEVTSLRLDETDAAAQTCETSLIERVSVNIRGKEFKHERRAWIGSREFTDCVVGAPADDPADRPDFAEEPSGGCSTSTGGGSSLLALALGALVVLRRRRS
jgi:MYXO-CTERM domain-containing protein